MGKSMSNRRHAEIQQPPHRLPSLHNLTQNIVTVDAKRKLPTKQARLDAAELEKAKKTFADILVSLSSFLNGSSLTEATKYSSLLLQLQPELTSHSATKVFKRASEFETALDQIREPNFGACPKNSSALRLLQSIKCHMFASFHVPPGASMWPQKPMPNEAAERNMQKTIIDGREIVRAGVASFKRNSNQGESLSDGLDIDDVGPEDYKNMELEFSRLLLFGDIDKVPNSTRYKLINRMDKSFEWGDVDGTRVPMCSLATMDMLRNHFLLLFKMTLPDKGQDIDNIRKFMTKGPVVMRLEPSGNVIKMMFYDIINDLSAGEVGYYNSWLAFTYWQEVKKLMVNGPRINPLARGGIGDVSQENTLLDQERGVGISASAELRGFEQALERYNNKTSPSNTDELNVKTNFIRAVVRISRSRKYAWFANSAMCLCSLQAFEERLQHFVMDDADAAQESIEEASSEFGSDAYFELEGEDVTAEADSSSDYDSVEYEQGSEDWSRTMYKQSEARASLRSQVQADSDYAPLKPTSSIKAATPRGIEAHKHKRSSDFVFLSHLCETVDKLQDLITNVDTGDDFEQSVDRMKDKIKELSNSISRAHIGADRSATTSPAEDSKSRRSLKDTVSKLQESLTRLQYIVDNMDTGELKSMLPELKNNKAFLLQERDKSAMEWLDVMKDFAKHIASGVAYAMSNFRYNFGLFFDVHTLGIVFSSLKYQELNMRVASVVTFSALAAFMGHYRNGVYAEWFPPSPLSSRLARVVQRVKTILRSDVSKLRKAAVRAVITVGSMFVTSAVVNMGAYAIERIFSCVNGDACLGLSLRVTSVTLAYALKGWASLNSLGKINEFILYVDNPTNTRGVSLIQTVVNGIRWALQRASTASVPVSEWIAQNPTYPGLYVVVVAIGLTFAYFNMNDNFVEKAQRIEAVASLVGSGRADLEDCLNIMLEREPCAISGPINVHSSNQTQ